MLLQQTLAQLRALSLNAMVQALEHQLAQPALQSLPFEERLAMLVDTETQSREQRRITRRLRDAKLKVPASPEDIDFRAERGLNKAQLQGLLSCEWINRGQNILVTGATGSGKTWLACALLHQAIRRGFTGYYTRLPRLLEEVEIAREVGNLAATRARLQRQRVLILDDWGVAALGQAQRQDLLELIDDRTQTLSTIVTSQIPVEQWHDYIGDATLADAIMDRLIHTAHRIDLRGESLRKQRAEDRS